jgi:hypothetical protein
MKVLKTSILWPLILLTVVVGCSSIPKSHIRVSDPQLKCLAEAIHGEARGEPRTGKIFVGRVVMTRLSRGFAPNICSVVYARYQFAPRGDFGHDSLNAAIEARRRGPNGVTHFHSYSKKKSPAASFSMSPQCIFKTKVGGHWGYFCNEGRSPASNTR